MSLTDTYLITTKNLEAFLNAVQGAQAPERFTNKFLDGLDFSSSNDRLFIKLMKELKFIDEAGLPTQRYYDFLDQGEAKAVLANAIKEAYADLFAVNKTAWKLTVDEIKNKFRTLTQGKKSDKVIHLMANTFKALCDYADWESADKKITPQSSPAPEEKESPDLSKNSESIPTRDNLHESASRPLNSKISQLHYNIQIHLPDSRDPAVFDAIFQGLKKHLL